MHELLHYGTALLGLGALLPAVTYASPRFRAHFLPLLTVVLALVCWFLPTGFDLALSLVLPVTLIHRFMGIDPMPSDHVEYGPAVRMARSALAKVEAAVATVSSIRVVRVGTQPAETEVTEFVKHAYPSPDTSPDTVSDDTGDAGDRTHADASVDERGLVDEVEKPKAPAANFDWRARLREIHSPGNWVGTRSLS